MSFKDSGSALRTKIKKNKKMKIKIEVTLLILIAILILILGGLLMVNGLFYIGFFTMICSIVPAGFAIELLEK
jgi:hypothetical protein